jgi:GTP-binding protein EngB required for normal cell division
MTALSDSPRKTRKGRSDEQNLELLNENHQLRLRVTFQHIDSLLTEVEQVLGDSASESPFNRYRGDTTPMQQKVAHDYVLRIRAAMARIMTEERISFAKPCCDRLRAANTALVYAAIAVDELDPERLRGYGQISDAGENLLEAIGTELHSVIGKLQNYLAQGANANLQARAERLEKASRDATSLEDMSRIITSHGLIDYREALAFIIDRIENNVFEIGVFGRVSSGKSSLLNYLLGIDYLPVGVIPITAVPTRISYGPLAQVAIEFADDPPEIVSFSDLWKYATEQGNPNNARHVIKIHLKLPNSRLDEGIAFVDTPGLGSLATSGSAEALAYLPRCDLGLLMLDASLGISAEDAAVVEALYRTGGSATILISKADRFNGDERTQLVEYVAREFEHQLGISPPIFPVSVMGESSMLSDNWYKEHMQAMLRSKQSLAAAATTRKIAALRNALIATLEARLTRGGKSVPNVRSGNKEVLNAFGAVEKSFDNIFQRSFELGQGICDQNPFILKCTVDKVAVARRDRSDVDSSQILAATITELLAEPIAQMEEEYNRIRNQAAHALDAAEKTLPHGLTLELPRAAGMPPLYPASLARTLQLKEPVPATVLSLSLVKWRLHRKLRRQISSDLTDFLDLYATQVRNWLRGSVDALKNTFEPAADMYRIQLQSGEIPVAKDRLQTSADLDRLKANL